MARALQTFSLAASSDSSSSYSSRSSPPPWTDEAVMYCSNIFVLRLTWELFAHFEELGVETEEVLTAAVHSFSKHLLPRDMWPTDIFFCNLYPCGKREGEDVCYIYSVGGNFVSGEMDTVPERLVNFLKNAMLDYCCAKGKFDVNAMLIQNITVDAEVTPFEKISSGDDA